MYGCTTQFLILQEERRLQMFENRGLRSMSGLKRDEVPEDWRKTS
jgi:hypothetical protein